jgi:hypothetical protein
MINLSSFIRYHATRTPQRVAIVYAIAVRISPPSRCRNN